MSEMKNPIFLSLDVDNWNRAHELSGLLSGYVGGFKVGPRLALKAQAKDWQRLSDCGPIFFDPKFYDIPNTMIESLKACAGLGFQYVTIHASSGLKAMKVIYELEKQIAKTQPFKILAVTALTSFDEQNPVPGHKNQNMRTIVLELAQLVKDSGLSGLVCSGEEVEMISRLDSSMFSVVPGIRLPEDSNDDQARVMTPDKALKLGAKALVVGRSIISASDPVAKAKSFLDVIS